MMPWIIALAVVAILGGGGAWWISRRLSLQRQIAARVLPNRADLAYEPSAQGIRTDFAEEWLGTRIPEENLPGWLRWFGQESARAGFRLGALDTVAVTVAIGAIMGLGCQIAVGFTRLSLLVGLIASCIFVIFLNITATRRVRRLEEQLADLLDAAVGALQAGIGLRQALEIVRGSRKPPISHWLNTVFAMMDVGVPLAQAMRETTRSLRSKYFDLLTIAVDANVEAGSSLTPMLLGLSHRIRDSIRLRRRVQSITAESRLSVIALFVILYAIGLYVWYMRPDNILFLMSHPIGSILLKIALAMQVVGTLWILYLLKTKE